MERDLLYILDTIRQICNNTDEGYVLIDRDYRIVWVNQYLEKKGFKLQNIRGSLYFRTFNNKDKIDENCSTASAFKTGKVENKIEEGKDGKFHHVTSIPLKFDNEIKYVLEISREKNVNEAVAEVKDIKPGLEPLNDENKLFGSEYIAEHCFDSIYFTDKDKRIISVNQAFEKLKGCSKEEVIGEVPAIFKSKKTDQGIYREFWNKLDKGEIWEQDYVGKTKSNNPYYSHMKIIPIKNELGKIINFMVIEKNISDWKKSEENLLRYKSFPDDSNDPVLQTDYDGNITFIGDKSKSAFDEINLKNIKELIGESSFNALDDIKYKGIGKKVENTIVMKDKNFQVQVVDVPSIEALNFYFSDITDIKKLEKTILERNEELEKFNRIAINRELKMIELKKRIKEQEGKLKHS